MPNFENMAFKSLARVSVDNPDTQRLRESNACLPDAPLDEALAAPVPPPDPDLLLLAAAPEDADAAPADVAAAAVDDFSLSSF